MEDDLIKELKFVEEKALMIEDDAKVKSKEILEEAEKQIEVLRNQYLNEIEVLTQGLEEELEKELKNFKDELIAQETTLDEEYKNIISVRRKDIQDLLLQYLFEQVNSGNS